MNFQIQRSQPTGKRFRDWEPHLPKIKRLRYEEKKPVKEIIVILKDEDSFVASEREYKERLAQDVRKNLKKEEKIQIALKQYERLLKYNKQSIFYLGGQVVDMQKIKRYMKSNKLSVEDIYGNVQNISVLLPPSISVCTPPSSPILEAANALPHLQLSVDSTTAAVREFGKDTDNDIEDTMLSLSLEDSTASPTLPQTTLQYAPTVSRSSSAQFRSFWTQFRSDTKSGSPYACEMSLKSQASLKPSLFSVASRSRPCIPSFSTPPLPKVMGEWERNDLSRTQYLCTKAPSSADGTIYPHVTTLDQERPKAYFDVELVGIAVNTELQEDGQDNHFFFEQDMISEEDEVLKKSEPQYSWKSKDDYNYQTSLLRAARNGHEAVVELLPEKGAELETKDASQGMTSSGRTLLSLAAGNGHEAVVKLLLEKGAKLETNDDSGQTPLSWAAENGHEEVVKLLLEKGAKLESKNHYNCRTPLSWAARNGHKAVVKLLLEKGAAELETKYRGGIFFSGRTPLSLAAQNGHEEVVKLLLEKGAELETKDAGQGISFSGRTPLSWAAGNGHEAVVKLLLEKGAKLETNDDSGQTPLSWAAQNGHEEVVKLLLEKKRWARD